jgi:hypothetical protein
MSAFGILCRAALVRTDNSEERIASIIRVTRIGTLETLAVTSNRSMLGSISSQSADSCHSDDGDDTVLRNTTAAHPIRRHSSNT